MNFTQAMEMVVNFRGHLTVQWNAKHQTVEYFVNHDSWQPSTVHPARGFAYIPQPGDTDAAIRRGIVNCAVAYCIAAKADGVEIRDPAGIVPLPEHRNAEVELALEPVR